MIFKKKELEVFYFVWQLIPLAWSHNRKINVTRFISECVGFFSSASLDRARASRDHFHELWRSMMGMCLLTEVKR